MTHRSGRIIAKRMNSRLFRNRYYVKVKFDKAFDRKNTYEYEYEVEKNMYENVIIGAFIRGEFEQSPEGLTPMYIY